MRARLIRNRLVDWIRTHRLRLLILFVCVLAPLWLFGWLADELLEGEAFVFDRPTLLWLHAHATPTLDRLMVFCSLLGVRFGVVPLDLLVFGWLLWRHRRGDAFFWALAVGGSALLNLGAKHTFGRVRPDLWLSIAPEKTYSFPSGHAMGSMSCVAALIVLLWPTRWRQPALAVGVPFVLLVGLSRVYLGVHFPSDILAGWAAALAWVIGVSLVLYGRASKPWPHAEPVATAG